MKTLRYILLLVILMIHILNSEAQVFPVQVSTQLLPPYTPYLADYTAPGAQKIRMQIRLNDPTVSEFACKLRITIEGVGITIRTKPTMAVAPLRLQGGGVPLALTGDDLVDYFNPNNLDFAGITRRDYESKGRLPEGVYRFTVEVLDYNRNTIVSNKGLAVAWILLNDPPLLNLPQREAKVKIIDPTNIVFNWTPRHTGSPNAAFTTEYNFKLVEIWPASRNPFDAMLSQVPLYEATITSTQFVYGPAEPALIPGRKYAWQVQARDVEGRDLFKNQGKSEVFVFQFGDALGVPANVWMQSASPSSLTLRWDQPQAEAGAINYRLRYRPKGKSDFWYEATTGDQWKALLQLQPDSEYEVQVRAEQQFQLGGYTPSYFFRTKRFQKDAFVCKDDVVPPPVPAQNIPVFELSLNDTIHAGGYKVLVRKLSGAQGRYSGEGVAIVPWFNAAKVRVTFENITVNQQFWLTSGTIHSVWKADSKFLLNVEKPYIPGKGPVAGEIDVNIIETDSLIRISGAAIVSVTKDEHDNVIVETSDGKKQTLEKGQSYSIVDEVGNGYVIDKDGNIAKTTSAAALAAHERGKRTYNLQLRFAKGEGKYGFDEKKFEALAHYYQQVEGGSFIPWKAVTAAKPDKLNAVLEGKDIEHNAIKFEAGGSPLSAETVSATNLQLSVSGKAKGVVEELIAYQTNPSNDREIVGKVNLVSYDLITKKLVIVPVNKAALPTSATQVTQGLNEIFAQAVTDWQVSVASPVTVELGGQFDDGETGLLTNYTMDMKKVINAFGKLQSDTYYLFLVDLPLTHEAGLSGYMPRSKQAGFVFTRNNNASTIVHTMAHELGHGAFNLQHTFKEHNLPKNSTDNLMDYNGGTALYKYQWDQVHDPAWVVGLFEKDEDAALLLQGPPFQIIEVANNSSAVRQVGPEVVKLLQRADAILNRAILAEKALHYGKVGSAAAIFIAGVLYSPDLGPAKAYQLHIDLNKSLEEWRSTLGIVDGQGVVNVAHRLNKCDFDNVAYQKLLIYDYLEIYHDYALMPEMGLEELEIIPASLRTHQVIIKAQEAGDLIGGYGNRVALKRNYKTKPGPQSSVYFAYDQLIRSKLDNVLIKKPSITPGEAFAELKHIICAVQEAMHSLKTQRPPTEQNYFQIKRIGDDLFTDPSWMAEYFQDPDEVELENYERRLAVRDDLDEYEWNRYLELLCVWRNDCRFNTAKYEDHHIIPKELENHLLVVAAKQCTNKFSFNGKDNLITLEKYILETDQGRHGNHPKYNDWILKLLDKERQDYIIDYGLPPDPCTAKEILVKIITKALGIIRESSKKINLIGEEQLKLFGQ